MIVHNKKILENAGLAQEAQKLSKAGFIPKEQYEAIIENLTLARTNDNLLVRVLFFILGTFLYSSICGFFTLLVIDSIDNSYEFLLFFFAIIGFAGAEVLSRSKFNGHGLDDAFILGAQLTLAIAIGANTNSYELVIASFITLTALLSYLRYLHLSMALLFCFAFATVVVYSVFSLPSFVHSFLPFIMMTFAATLYFGSKKLKQKLEQSHYYLGLTIAQKFALVLFYFSGNYLVVRELSIELLGQDVAAGSDIPFAYLFYAFTFVVPAGYLYFALVKKDRILLWIGLLSLSFSIYTIRFYYAITPIEIVLTIGGALLFVTTLFTIRKLKNKETGITFQADRFTETNAFLAAEIVVTSQMGSMKPEVPVDSPMEFGGGDFSGGGSGGSF